MPRLADVATGVIAMCALIVTGIVVKREFFDDRVSSPAPPSSIVRNAEAYARGGHVVGPAGARVVLVEFSDFECEFCARFSATIRGVMRAFPNDLVLVYRHFPLAQTHPHAFAAALASECAADQGKFAPFHDVLFASRDSIGLKPWEAYARKSGVSDLPKFTACVQDSVFKARVLADIEAGKRLGVVGTPTFLLNDRLISGALDSAQLASYVRDALPKN